MPSIIRSLLPILAGAVYQTTAQTYSACNPITNPGVCPADPALGRSVTISFNQASDSFTDVGTINYGSNGAEFTVAKSGDNPHITSEWYIMFGHVEFEIQAAPGQGIVSSAVLMSDILDEIDWEWLGGDDNQVQSNWFREGQTVTGYNRGAFHAAPGNHDSFHKYGIDWTADQIVWSIDGQTVRVLEASNAQNGDYPQTPMQIKVGSWAGGDPSNPQGTIDWAGGLTDYSAGPFTMYLKSIAVTDYSTGKAYTYSGTAGTWESIQSEGGSVNPQGNGQPVSTSDAPAITSTVPNDSSAPLAFDPDNSASAYATRTGWPWVGTATASVVPSGWSIDGNGNIHPPSSGAAPYPSSSYPSDSSPVSVSGSGPESFPSGSTNGPSATGSLSSASDEPNPTIAASPASTVAETRPSESTAVTAQPSANASGTSGVTITQTPASEASGSASLTESLSTSSGGQSGSTRASQSSIRSESLTTIASGRTSSAPTASATEQSAGSTTSTASTSTETPEAPAAGAGQIGHPRFGVGLCALLGLLLL